MVVSFGSILQNSVSFGNIKNLSRAFHLTHDSFGYDKRQSNISTLLKLIVANPFIEGLA